MSKRIEMNRLLLVSGSGRNSGKTSLLCEIIKNVSATATVYALKISPHFHQHSEKQELLVGQEEFSIFRETDMDSNKDSSRMLIAGAKESLYLQCDDKAVSEAFKRLIKFIPKNCPIVCESGSLAKSVQPGLHLYLGSGNKKNNRMDMVDQTVHFDGEDFDLNINRIVFNGTTWVVM